MTTVERALNDVLGFGYLPSNVTVATLKDYRPKLDELALLGVEGNHKIQQLLKYLDKGLPGLLHADNNQGKIDLPPIEEIVRKIKNK